MTDEIRRTPAAESETDQAWDRFTEEPGARNLGALRSDEFEGWMVTLWVMEHIGYEDPFGAEYRSRVRRALEAVDGVDAVCDQSRETWTVMGPADGRVLLLAAAQVVDDLADQARPYAG